MLTGNFSAVVNVLPISIRVEEIVIIVALLDHPDDDEDDDVEKVFFDKETADRRTNSRSVQSAVAVHCRVDGNYDVQGKCHGKH